MVGGRGVIGHWVGWLDGLMQLVEWQECGIVAHQDVNVHNVCRERQDGVSWLRSEGLQARVWKEGLGDGSWVMTPIGPDPWR